MRATIRFQTDTVFIRIMTSRVSYSPKSRTFRKIGIKPPEKNMVNVIRKLTNAFPANLRLSAYAAARETITDSAEPRTV